jgi:hypothetical protein
VSHWVAEGGMALHPVMVNDFRLVANAGQPSRDNHWKWVWNQEKKQGRWVHVNNLDEIPAPVKQVWPTKPAAVCSPNARINEIQGR